MLMKPKYILVLIVAWLVVAGLIIVPRFIFKQPISTNATNVDIVNAIYSLKDTIYTATAIGVGVILAEITRK